MKKYKAILKQPSSNEVDHLPLIDDVGGDWNYHSQGIAHYVKAGAFADIDKVFIPSYLNGNSGGVPNDLNQVSRALGVLDANTLELRVSENGELSDGFLHNFPIEFEIYP